MCIFFNYTQGSSDDTIRQVNFKEVKLQQLRVQ